MQHLYGLLVGLIVGLFSLIVSVIVVIEHAAREGLERLGIGGQVQTALLALLLLGLIALAFRWFGKLFGILIGVFLLLVLLHSLFASGGGSVSI
ncbi:hypothetical protein [Kozakia baliensis]|uniref:Uncharacterized protein n=1 Tax=Kozakia baliensis TaxID=153496 RepID=A0A1D8UUU9_9PROT|nr:hypothetical protein [Kozakia baliensis]AOX17416.1 hypothetical protein A0U89_10005 [Kozakia baliensis]AOX20293.1 hypothetical protein A0U90_08290 [Kozakia baliensis]GBR30418.1 hypothetical protein AA0488_1991 [Kozakia baliensis NRIC 0488]GEL63131.1 hypothetical protein KBA01_04170 [Kozakia baliensis]